MRVRAGALVVVALVSAGCGGSGDWKAAPTTNARRPTTTSSSTTPPTRTLQVRLALEDPDEGWGDAGGACEGSGGYADIAEGASVVARDETNTVVAAGRLGPGEQFLGACLFVAELRNVPIRLEFLTIETAGRGGPMYSQYDLFAHGWTVGLALGP